jgi:hypothetical protein
MRSDIRLSICLLVLLATALSHGCAFGEIRPEDRFRMQYNLDEVHKQYTDYVRWSKFNQASQFMDKADRPAFLRMMPDFDEVRFSDWKAKPYQLNEELTSTTIEVTYRGYSMTTPFEVKVHESQEWQREGKGNVWKLKNTTFHDLDQLAGR